MKRLPLLPFIAVAVVGCSEPEVRTEYPTEPIQVIVPFGAGGGTDSFARIIEKGIEDNELFPQPLVIVNLGGAGGTIGSRRLKDAPPDGHTVMVLHNAILTARMTHLVDYGPEAFEVVAATGFVGQVVAVLEDDDAPKSLDELLARARENPGESKWACNLGALTHFSGLQLQQSRKADGAEFNFVPSGGGADRYAALKGGHADVTGFSLEEFTRYRSDGIRGLCFLGAERYPGLDLPTARELGYTEVVRDNLFYWWMPKGTPRDRVEAFADALERAMQVPEVYQKLERGLIEPVFLRGDEARERLRAAELRNATIAVPTENDLPNFPLILLGCVGVLALVAVGEVVLWGRRGDAEPVVSSPADSDAPPRPRVDLALWTFGVVTAFVAVLTFRLVEFRIATFLFVLLVGGALVHRRPALVGGLLALAAATSLGLHAVFTRLFEIVLP